MAKFQKFNDGVRTSLCITPSQEIANCAVTFVLDVSSSMLSPAQIKAKSGEEVDNPWSMHDMQIHAVMAGIESMTDDDLVSIVIFSNDAKKIVSWTKCTIDGKRAIHHVLNTVNVGGCTNLSDGIMVGFSSFSTLPPKSYSQHLVVSTDGNPSPWTIPTGGYTQLVMRERLGIQDDVNVVAIAIGYELDSKMLLSMSDSFLHIPTANSVGPFIAHLFASLRSTTVIYGIPVSRARLRLTPESSDPFFDGAIGNLIANQPRYFVIHNADECQLQIGHIVIDFEVADAEYCMSPRREIEMKLWSELTRENRNILILDIESHPNIKKTIDTEIDFAARAVNWDRWGRHYYRTLADAIRLERRTNFEDFIMKNWTSDVFDTCLDVAEMAFAQVTPPTPYNSRQVTNHPTAYSMPRQAMQGGGCITGPSLASTIVNGIIIQKQVEYLQAGDLVLTRCGQSKIRCVVAREGICVEIIQFECGLGITKYHPIIDNDDFIYPVHISSNVLPAKPRTLYSFVLEDHHSMLVGNRFCITLGHGIENHPVATHTYWGKDIIEELKQHPDWSSGKIKLYA